MKRHELFNMIETVYGHLRYKESPRASVIDNWLTDLEYINSNAIPHITTQLKDLDTLPRNLPKLIKSIFAIWRRQNAAVAFVQYDPYEDLRFPINKLYTATETFITEGEQAFNEYCAAHYMPSQDRDRCRNKAKRIIDKEAVAGLIDRVGENVADNKRKNNQALLWGD